MSGAENDKCYLICICGKKSTVCMVGNNTADGKSLCVCGRHITVHLRRAPQKLRKQNGHIAQHSKPKIPAEVENFICYLIDNCERDIITEEYLQDVVIKFINSRYFGHC